jgi:iron complex outermembrane receptor protein
MNLSATQSEISIRGFNRELSNKVLVLVDGRSTYTDIVGSTLWGGLPITLDEIERIEIIRGPGSAVYGGNAVTGVINIITKTPGEQEEHLVRLDAGTSDLARASGMANGRQGSTAYRFSAAYTQHGRWTKDTGVGPGVPVVPLIEDQDLAQKTMQANARVDRPFGEKGLISVSAGMNDGSYEYYNIGALGDYGMDATNWYARGDVSWDPVHLRVFWNALDGTTGPWLEPAGTNHRLASPIRNDVVDTEVESPLSFKTGIVDHTLNLGLGWRHERFQLGYLEGGFDTPYSEEHFAFFLNEAAKIEKTTVVASLRVDRHPNIADLSKTISPRGALIYRLFEKTALRATAGTAFRSPNPIENYMRFDLGSSSANGAYIEDFGNLNLIPERILTLELGAHDESTFYHMADLAVFYNRVTDLIGLEPVLLGPNYFDAANDGFELGETGWANLDPTYSALGAELDTELYPTDGMDIFLNLALNRINETNGDDTLADESTSFAKVNAGVTWRTPWRTDLTGAIHYASPQVWRLREFDAVGGIALNEAPLAARVLPEARVAVRPLPKDDLELAINAWNFTALLRDDADLQAAGAALADAKAAGAATAIPGDGEADYATVQTYQEHPKGQPLGGRLYGSVTWRF